jgi:hypothetical protein
MIPMRKLLKLNFWDGVDEEEISSHRDAFGAVKLPTVSCGSVKASKVASIHLLTGLPMIA